MELKTLCIAYFLYRWLKRFWGTSTDGRSCLIGQIPAKRCLPQVSSRDIVAGLFSNTFDSGAVARKSAAQKSAVLLPPHPSATRCIQQRSQSYLNTIFGKCQATEISNCRAYENEATHNGESSYAEEGIHTHPHSDHMKFERPYEAAESMIKLLLVARANFGHLLVSLLQIACL